MLFYRFNGPAATAVRLVGLAAIFWSVLESKHPPAGSGRGLVVAIALTVAAIGFLAWTARPGMDQGLTPDLFLMAGAGGLLCGACLDSAASAFVFVAVLSAGLRGEFSRVAPVAALGAFALAVSVLVYDESALGLLAYALGFAAAALGASNSRQSIVRAEQAELLLAQTERSREEQLRTARLEESTRIAREIHDVLAHALAGLTIQLEATRALVERGAGRDVVLERVRRAHELAREGLRETRYAVGALRGEPVSVETGLGALVAEFRFSADAPIELELAGDPDRMSADAAQAVLRVAQEALTNVRKHAPGASVSISLDAGAADAGELVLVVLDAPQEGVARSAASVLASAGGGFGLRGMRERAELLGGQLVADADGERWRVELRLPLAAADGGEANGGGEKSLLGAGSAQEGER